MSLPLGLVRIHARLLCGVEWIKSSFVSVWRQHFESGRSPIMIWGTFADDKMLPMAIMQPQNRTATDFVELKYDAAIGPWVGTRMPRKA